MNNSQTQTPPWEDIAASTALPPSIQPDTKPWEDIQSKEMVPFPSSSPATNQTFQQDKNYPPQATNPPEQQMVQGLSHAISGMAAGTLGGMAAEGITNLFESVPDLLDAGIKPKTLQSMTPQGMTPTDFGKVLQSQLNAEKIIVPGDSNATLKNMLETTTNDGESVGKARDAIAQVAGPQAVTINAQQALQPIYDAWGKEVNANVPDGRTLKIIGDHYNGLMKTAQSQGGNLSLDNIHDFLQEIGPKVHAGSEANQAIYSNLYKVGLNAQKGMINAVAQNSGDETLASNLLNANARYTRDLQLLPDIARNDAGEAIKAGISAFQKYHGPEALKYGGTVLGTLAGEGLISKLYHIATGGGE